jgi:DNA-directed RNA polymerase subunit M/transcription elongation factor TFIIS
MSRRNVKTIPVAGDRIFLGFEAILGFFEDKQGITPANFAELELRDRRRLFGPLPYKQDGESDAVRKAREVREIKIVGEIHDVSMMMMRMGPKRVYDYLRNVAIPILNEMIEDRQEQYFSIITFTSPLLAEYAKKEEAVLALNENKGPLTDAASCKRCGALQVHRRIAQTRSADEGFSSIFICPQCSFSWVEN